MELQAEQSLLEAKHNTDYSKYGNLGKLGKGGVGGRCFRIRIARAGW